MEEEGIVNRVAQSSLVSLDLDEYIEDEVKTTMFDLADLLFQGMILREKDFRDFVKQHNWSEYEGQDVVLFCSADAIIPVWAYMLITSKLSNIARNVVIGTKNDLEKIRIDNGLAKIDSQEYIDRKVVIKGCGDIENRDYAYLSITRKLVPVVSSLMYGEPCSTVPIYKKPRIKS